MTFKGILFYLFLYVCLAWVGSAYLYSGPKITEIGLLWTGAGIVVVLSFLLLSRLWGLIRRARAASAAKPKRPPAPPAAVNESEQALRALFAEANAALQKSQKYANEAEPVSSLPAYLLVGPEGAGKTSTFLHSGLEPQLLAGQTGSPSAQLPTRFCNLWLAQDSLFIEIGGVVFNDLNRWSQLLRAFVTKPVRTSWKRFWSEPAPNRSFYIRAVVAFCDVKDFGGASNAQASDRLTRLAAHWRERLIAMAEIFGAAVPIHVLVTKCDSLPFLSDYFRRMPEAETDQVLGCAFDAREVADASGSPEAESKRLTKAFTSLYHALAERRILHLAHEPDRSRRPAVYEFPRELKRIRPALMQFLTELFRPHALGPNLDLRGFYFSATGERQQMQAPPDSAAQWSENSMEQEATVLFRADATQIFRPNDARAVRSVAIPGTTPRWMFVAELFRTVIPASRPPRTAALVDNRFERQRQVACAVVCGICAVLVIAFLTSWQGNRALLDDVARYAEPHIRGTSPTLADMQSLDDLRVRVNQLTLYQHEGAPWRLRWGLYAGDRIVGPARALYFRRFQELLLNGLNEALITRLQALPSTPGLNDPYTPAFVTLRTHLMISSGACPLDPTTIAATLKSMLGSMEPANGGSEWRTLAAKQIDFYVSELPYGNPCHIVENASARDHARAYLKQIHGPDRLYASVLGTAERTFPKPFRLADFSANYSEVLAGPPEVNGVFSRDGWPLVKKLSQENNATSSADACVLGETASSGLEPHHDTETAEAVQRLYLRDYAEAWRSFISSFSVKRYASAADAARKLELLSDHKSPLLALFAITSNQTNFPAAAVDPAIVDRVAPVVQKWIPFAKSKAAPGSAAPPALTGTDALTRSFQPIHSVVAPNTDTWVTEKNSAYVDALAQLSHSMQDIARAGATPDPALYQAASQNYDKALDAARQIARTFEPLGVAGLDVTAERLLEAPVRQTAAFIISDPLGAEAAKVNGALHPVCARLRDTLRKFPFSPAGPDASLEDVSGLFAPGRGLVWKFQAESLGDYVVKDGNSWKTKDPSKKPQVTQELVTFLNRAQTLTDAFYPNGSTQPQFTYTLRPKLDASYRDAVLELEIDGHVYAWTSSIQKQFTWTAGSLGGTAGVVGRVRTGALSFPFASRGGSWAIFHVMDDAEPRPIGSKLVEWKHMRGGDGRVEEIQPAPVRLEIVDFPGGADLFNPKFFESLQCPVKAVQ